MSDIKVLALVGSLRAASVNRQIAGLAAAKAPAGIEVNLYRGLGGGLGELPLYDEDIDNAADLPASAHTLRGAVAAADAILVVTPEYNGSIPGGLKNAIDWLSRPYGQMRCRPSRWLLSAPRWASTAGCGRTMRPVSRSGSPEPTLSMRRRSRCRSTHWVASLRARATTWLPASTMC
jgi:NAD(P)H-dependent FMN reductase